MAFYIAAETDDLVTRCDDDFTEEMVAEVAPKIPYLIYFEV